MRVAAIQMVSSGGIDHNLAQATKLIVEAKRSGAELAVLPENFLSYGLKISDVSIKQQALISQLASLAKVQKIWLVCGTIPYFLEDNLPPSWLATPRQDRPFATCMVFDNDGQLRTQYHKVHLFDADVNDSTGNYRESAIYAAGDDVGLFTTDWGLFGIAVCYDLRFPEYFRLLANAGVTLVLLPAAFTYVTGKAHWEVLLRARAIENQCFIVAANQGGVHSESRRTWGESMIINPWGEVICKIAEGEGVVCADIDLSIVDKYRKEMPVLAHRRF